MTQRHNVGAITIGILSNKQIATKELEVCDFTVSTGSSEDIQTRKKIEKDKSNTGKADEPKEWKEFCDIE